MTLPCAMPEYRPLVADARYPGFVATERHAVDGYGLQRLCKENRFVVVAAGPDVALIELLVGIAGSSLLALASWHEVGWFFAERVGDRWEFSIEAGGHFTISHASLVRVSGVIDALREGRVSDVGESLDADEWDRRYGWAHESGLVDSRLEALDALAFRYVSLLKEEGIVPGRTASAELESIRTELLVALEAEGITNRAQPDAIFYQLRERNCNHLREILDALDMSFHLSEICGEVIPAPGTDSWRCELFSDRPAIPGRHHVAIDWWIIDPVYPWDGSVGTVNFAHYCNQVLERSHVVDLDPVVMEFLGKRLFLLVGRHRGKVELRGVLPENAVVQSLIRRVRQTYLERIEAAAPPLTDVAEREAQSGLPLPMALRAFLEQVGNGGRLQYVQWLTHEEIITNNDPVSWQRPCPALIREAREMFDWDCHEIPDGLLCISGYFYNGSRAFLLADGRVVWLTPTETGYRIDPPRFWLCSLL
jgi:hypothetical protein